MRHTITHDIRQSKRTTVCMFPGMERTRDDVVCRQSWVDAEGLI